MVGYGKLGKIRTRITSQLITRYIIIFIIFSALECATWDECTTDIWQKFVLPFVVTILNLACVITGYYRFHDLICGKNKTVICHQVRDLKLSVLELENEFEEFVTLYLTVFPLPRFTIYYWGEGGQDSSVDGLDELTYSDTHSNRSHN